MSHSMCSFQVSHAGLEQVGSPQRWSRIGVRFMIYQKYVNTVCFPNNLSVISSENNFFLHLKNLKTLLCAC